MSVFDELRDSPEGRALRDLVRAIAVRVTGKSSVSLRSGLGKVSPLGKFDDAHKDEDCFLIGNDIVSLLGVTMFPYWESHCSLRAEVRSV